MEEICCIFCSIGSTQVVIEENGYQGRQCPRCGLIYISPRPSLEELVVLYEKDSAHISTEDHVRDEFAKRLYARHHLKLIRALVKSGDLLEIGAGAGYFLDEARKSGFTTFGLELNPGLAKFIRDQLHIPCEESLLPTPVFGGRKFDVVYHCDVISHFYDPISEFENIAQILNPEGFLIFETGNIAEVDPGFFKHYDLFQYPEHLFFFGENNLKDLLTRTGFQLQKLFRFSILTEMKYRARLERIYKKKFHSLPGKVIGRIRNLIYLQSSQKALTYLNYLLRYPFGAAAVKARTPQTMIVMAQKKPAASL